jgi:hypothetical protein
MESSCRVDAGVDGSQFQPAIGYQFRYFKLKVTGRQLAAIAEREEYSIYVSAR